MATNYDEPANSQAKSGPRIAPGWTKTHSWIFLGLVAVGLLVIVFQNRYFYLMPEGAAKLFRISKLSGSIQEYDPSGAWVAPQFASTERPQVSEQSSPPSRVASQAVPMNVPAGTEPKVAPPQRFSIAESKPETVEPPVVKPQTMAPQAPSTTGPATESPRTREAPAARPAPAPREQTAMSREQKFKAFKQMFPDYSDAEFELADEDLFPDWQKKLAPNGSWSEFLKVYKEFIDWFNAQGSPEESGTQLWEEFLAGKGQ